MEKNVESINDIVNAIEQLIAENFNDKNADTGFSSNESLSDRLDSLAICVLIVRLEDIYQISFPIEAFCKGDTIQSLAEKVFNIYISKQ